MSVPKQKYNRKNDRFALLQRRKAVAAYYVQGRSQWEIAQQLGVSQGTISTDLAAVRADWLASSVRDFDEAKAQELAKLDLQETELWAAWDKSKQDAETRHRKLEKVRPYAPKGKKGEPAPKPKLVVSKVVDETTARGQCGDPWFMEQILKIREMRLQIIGALKPGTIINQTGILIDWDKIASSTREAYDRALTRPKLPDTVNDRLERMLGESQTTTKAEPSDDLSEAELDAEILKLGADDDGE